MLYNNLWTADVGSHNKYSGFTLAEVLISLVIIGVIAALTISNIVVNSKKEEYVSKLKKAYSTLSQATNQIILEEGPASGWATSDVETYKHFIKKIRSAKDCGIQGGCFKQHQSGNHVYLNGQNDYGNWDVLPSFITADGVQVGFYPGNNPNPDYLMELYIDINGEKKPNKWGRDVFIFLLYPNGLTPGNCTSESNCSLTARGTNCACRVFKENAMNY